MATNAAAMAPAPIISTGRRPVPSPRRSASFRSFSAALMTLRGAGRLRLDPAAAMRLVNREPGGQGLVQIAAWAAFFGCYLLFAGQPSWSEAGVGVPAAGLATAFFSCSRHPKGRRLAFRRAPWRKLATPLVALLPDAVRVGRVLLRTLPAASRRRVRRAAGPVVPARR